MLSMNEPLLRQSAVLDNCCLLDLTIERELWPPIQNMNISTMLEGFSAHNVAWRAAVFVYECN